ncbi:MAG: hypothetical protein U9Q38_01425 [Thermodesulfobacteriota bacterium]|nr:hypothetical protein [Thermodesulfobacteriota bacterium]
MPDSLKPLTFFAAGTLVVATLSFLIATQANAQYTKPLAKGYELHDARENLTASVSADGVLWARELKVGPHKVDGLSYVYSKQKLRKPSGREKFREGVDYLYFFLYCLMSSYFLYLIFEKPVVLFTRYSSSYLCRVVERWFG